ncbi:hypothetical protein AMTR_s00001p00211280 [Amborella trichopoda]|uniref:Uncharacterized protein n=1 Tax=Amborella trichopoda TaxID=13333 RepID=W1NLH3_AMBTC|nr:hypothetical protein AMTR_s00001p00211280 [Amborella trichopoda]
MDRGFQLERKVELSEFLWSLQLEHECLTSDLDVLTKRNEELQRQLEDATGAGRNNQSDMEGANPEPQDPGYSLSLYNTFEP